MSLMALREAKRIGSEAVIRPTSRRTMGTAAQTYPDGKMDSLRIAAEAAVLATARKRRRETRFFTDTSFRQRRHKPDGREEKRTGCEKRNSILLNFPKTLVRESRKAYQRSRGKKLEEQSAGSYFCTGVMSATGRSQWARRISKRRCSSFS